MGLHINKTMLETPPMDDSPTFIPLGHVHGRGAGVAVLATLSGRGGPPSLSSGGFVLLNVDDDQRLGPEWLVLFVIVDQLLKRLPPGEPTTNTPSTSLG